MSELISMNARVKVGNRTFSVNVTEGGVNFRDLTESRTGKFVSEKQAKMLDKVINAARTSAGKLTLPVEAKEKAAAPRKAAAKAAPKGRGKTTA